MTGYIGSVAYFAFKYPAEWDHLSEFKSQKEMITSLGEVATLGIMRSSREGKVLEGYMTWTVENSWTGYSLNCIQYDTDQAIHYKIEYYNWLLPFSSGFTVRSGVAPMQIQITNEEKEYVEELRNEGDTRRSIQRRQTPASFKSKLPNRPTQTW